MLMMYCFFLSEPEKSVPALIELINWFSSFSGYKVNLTKSEAMPLGTLISKPNIFFLLRAFKT